MAPNLRAEPRTATMNGTDELHIRPLNIEKGSDRIGLSQRRNLVFVACNSQIYVWEPAGSSQTLGKKPVMIIDPLIKCPDNAGYITPHYPHSINNMLVGDLGLEEVLLCVTDSGNVCGYRVEAIFSVLERAEQADLERPFNSTDVTPFLVENVQSSAWGLAIHKFARQIAVSANTGLVTVFAFALAGPGCADRLDLNHPAVDSNLENNDPTWFIADSEAKFEQMHSEKLHLYRTQNVKMTYLGHFTNIPSVSFFNCDLDPNGKWMFSTDIDNKLLVWNVWESRCPVNVFHFNGTPSPLSGPEDRGWSVLALDPRTFRRFTTAEEAIGGPREIQKKQGKEFLNTTRLTKRIKDASPLYNHFPPAVRFEAEQSVLPDIFSTDCRAISSSDRETLTSDLFNTHYQRRDGVMSDPVDENADNANSSVAAPGDVHPSHSTDAFSHSAVDGSVQEGSTSQEISPDADAGTETGQSAGQNAEDTAGFGAAASFEDLIMQLGGLPQPATQGPLITAEFLQQALGDGQYLDLFMSDEYLTSFGNDGDDGDDDDEMDDEDEELYHGQEPEGEHNWGDQVNWEYPAHYVGPTPEAARYNELYCMSCIVFPDHPDLFGYRSLITDPQAAASDRFDFPIIHFSQTDIRLIPTPRALDHTIICYAPLRQRFSQIVEPTRAIDRFNMVQYVSEHGIIVAASQKGRAAIISLTESDATGPAFRLDWIVPFESQEKYGERPLQPLLGMAVSPMPGFEIPPDIPFIPHEDDIRGMGFRYELLNQDSGMSSAYSPSDQSCDSDLSTESPINQSLDKISSPTVPSPTVSCSKKQASEAPLTHAECHAWASRHHVPSEPWRGWNPSRRYRLMLVYLDHSVLTYEFWYENKVAGEKTKTPAGGNGGGEGDAMNDDPYLMI
ncbi:hypothetical protein PHISCL_02489 [Aspergillus sclerotialis]|uniref:Uncharacterized protein n=1 Tax=Aspergillus sclerotialis TaxID=2070753 RepID=A0A3A2ZR19_9EURO|nr:hypothetical protein PHISCL_02489 [Aspergillus sclerotialis]